MKNNTPTIQQLDALLAKPAFVREENSTVLAVKLADSINKQALRIYEENGVQGICRLGDNYSLSYKYCNHCNTETPRVLSAKKYDYCLACGQSY
jgi:hypothetical protein